MRLIRVLILLVVFALVASACGGDGDDETTTTASDETTAAPATTTSEPVESGFPWYNPPPIDPAPGTWAMHDYFTGVEGLNRCAWHGDGESFDDLGDCESKAQTIFAETTALLGQSTDSAEFAIPFGDGTHTLIKKDGHHVCLIDANEIVTTASEDAVEAALADWEVDVRQIDDPENAPLPTGLAAYALISSADDLDPIVASRVLLTLGFPASPRYALHPSPRWRFGPGGTALPADPSVAADQGLLTAGTVAPIAVIDTGIPPTNSFGAPWNEVINLTAWEPEPINIRADDSGHGLFIAGIIRRLLPDATITVRTPLPTNSEAPLVFDEHSVINAIDRARAEELSGGGIVNLSLGTYACEPDMIPLELAAYMVEASLDSTNIVFVAAAGNDSHGPDDDPFWPAGFSDQDMLETLLKPSEGAWPTDYLYELQPDGPDYDARSPFETTEIIGVGALVYEDLEWVPVWFSNQVGATTWAPGANIVSNYPGWEGFAQWDGTSFAAPHVAALVAAGLYFGS